MKTLPAILIIALTAIVFAPFNSEIAISLFAISGIVAIFFNDYRRPTKPLTGAALDRSHRLPLAG